MRVFFNKSTNNLLGNKEFLLFLFLFIICSYQKIFVVDYLDDICILFMGIFYMIKKIHGRFLKKYEFLYYVMIILYFSNTLLNNSLGDFFVFFKIVIIILYSLELNFYSYKEKKMALYAFLIISIPNIICGIYQYYMTHVEDSHVIGKYDGISGYRLQGFVGHPIHYSLLLVGVLIISLECVQMFVPRIILVVLLLFLIQYTAADFSRVLAVACILVKIFFVIFNRFKEKRIFEKFAMPLLKVAAVSAACFLFFQMGKEINTIRYVATVGTIRSITFTSFFVGHGIGAFTKMRFQEVYLVRVFNDMGMIGIGLLLYLIFRIFKKNIQVKNYYGVGALLILLLNMVINDGYMIPFIVMVPVFCSSLISETNSPQ